MHFSASFDVIELRADFQDRGDGEGVDMGSGGSGVGVVVEGGGWVVVLAVGGDKEVEDGECRLGLARLGFECLGEIPNSFFS